MAIDDKSYADMFANATKEALEQLDVDLDALAENPNLATDPKLMARFTKLLGNKQVAEAFMSKLTSSEVAHIKGLIRDLP